MGTAAKKPPLVLVIEDDPLVRELVAELLTQQEFRVAQASNGFSGMRLAESELPNLILLDLALPEVPGNVLLKELKADARTRGIPVLVTTAHPDMLDDGDEALVAGIMQKPFDMDALLLQVQGALRTARSRQARVPTAGQPAVTPHRPGLRRGAGAGALRRSRGH